VLYIYTGVVKNGKVGNASGDPIIPAKMALHGAARQPTVVNCGNRGEHITVPIPIIIVKKT